MPTLLPTSTQLGNTSIVKYISMIAEAQAETALPLSEKEIIATMQRIHTEEHVNNQKRSHVGFQTLIALLSLL